MFSVSWSQSSRSTRKHLFVASRTAQNIVCTLVQISFNCDNLKSINLFNQNKLLVAVSRRLPLHTNCLIHLNCFRECKWGWSWCAGRRVKIGETQPRWRSHALNKSSCRSINRRWAQRDESTSHFHLDYMINHNRSWSLFADSSCASSCQRQKSIKTTFHSYIHSAVGARAAFCWMFDLWCRWRNANKNLTLSCMGSSSAVLV